jgi:hypothetical protein
MGKNAYRDEDDADPTDAYWRRRTLTLAAGLGLLAILAWAFSGGGGKPAPVSLSPAPQASGLLPAAAYSGPPTSAPSSMARTVGTTPDPATPALPGLAAPSASPAGQAPQEPHAPGGRCSPGALVLSLFTTLPRYGAGQYPEFQVYAVSTAAGRCALDLGPAKLHVAVLMAGRVIWDSADCARGQPGQVTELSRGVPAKETVVWNRAVTLPGCARLASALPGTYQVQARTGSVSSPVRTFRLVR